MTNRVTDDVFDRAFDAGESDGYVDWDSTILVQPLWNTDPVIVQLEMLPNEVAALDRKACRAGKSRADLVREFAPA